MLLINPRTESDARGGGERRRNRKIRRARDQGIRPRGSEGAGLGCAEHGSNLILWIFIKITY